MDSREIEYFYLEKHRLTPGLQRPRNTPARLLKNQAPLLRMQNRPVALTPKTRREQKVGHARRRVRHPSVKGLPRLEPPPFFSQGGPQKMILALRFLSREPTQ